MIWLFSLGLLVLAAAVVVLYAMIGEVASRIPDTEPEARVTPLESYQRDAAVTRWPAGLDIFTGRADVLLLVLSPICNTCNKVAGDLAERDPATLPESLGVVVSCSTSIDGDAFVERYALNRLPFLVDEDGTWTHGNFGVRTSPSALHFQDRQLAGAYTFSTIESLLQHVGTVREGMS